FRSNARKSGIIVSKVVPGLILRMAFTVSAHIIEPPSLISSRSTEVITACLIFINLIERATFSGSFQSIDSGLPVFTPQKQHERVQVLPNIIKVAVPSPQQSSIMRQHPEIHNI